MTPGDERLRDTGEELLLVAAYLLSSGRGLLTEPAGYGPVRCLDAARRLLTLADRIGACGTGVRALQQELETYLSQAMEDRDLAAFLDDLCCRLAELLRAKDADTHG